MQLSELLAAGAFQDDIGIGRSRRIGDASVATDDDRATAIVEAIADASGEGVFACCESRNHQAISVEYDNRAAGLWRRAPCLQAALHAIEAGGKAYLVPLEGEKENVEGLVPLEWMLGELAKVDVRQKVFILDGGLDGWKKAGRPLTAVPYLRYLETKYLAS